MTKENFLKKRKTTLGFSVASLLGGAFFLSPTITGNAVTNESATSPLPWMGLTLIFCSIVLAIYSASPKKKK